MSMPIEVAGLHVSYRNKKGQKVAAVRDLSFEVQEGEVVGFLGPNGAGKSSTLKAIMGFLVPDQGTIRIFGIPGGELSARSQMGYLPEVALYYPYLTPRETLHLYGELQGLRGKDLRRQTDELLERVGLGHAANKTNRMLSKGMLQRVGIAQSLLGNPKLLVLDEMTSGLDPVGRRELRELLRAKQREGTTLFFSSHELAEVEMLCDRILLIHQGRLVEEREIPQLRDELREYRLAWRGAVSMVDLTDRQQATADKTVAWFHTHEQLIQAIDRVHGAEGDLLEVVAREGSLEDYFVDKIGAAA